MAISADCISLTPNGRNLTPPLILEDARYVLGNITLDPASDEIANHWVQASTFYSLEEDGFSKEWIADTVWLNPPGTSTSKGRVIKASHWFKKFLHHFKKKDIESGILLCYRAGSLGSIGKELLSFPLCLTCAGASSPIINGSGRLSFYTVENNNNNNNLLIPQTSNTQSSVFICVTNDSEIKERFKDRFNTYGVIK